MRTWRRGRSREEREMRVKSRRRERERREEGRVEGREVRRRGVDRLFEDA